MMMPAAAGAGAAPFFEVNRKRIELQFLFKKVTNIVKLDLIVYPIRDLLSPRLTKPTE